MKGITPCLWFDHQAEEAAGFYTSVFKDSKIGTIARYGEAGAKASGQPKGSVMTVTFQLEGQQFMALNGGPIFHFTPAVSFFVHCKTPLEIEELWKKLSEGATVLMELAQYPWSEKYGWLQDKFGVSWQLILANRRQVIAPSLLFVGEQYGEAEEAINFYVSAFPNSKVENISRYGANEEGGEGTVKYAVFSVNGQDFMAMESPGEHPFTFTHAISFMVNCETQKEIDQFWEQLSEGGQKEQCGWLMDRYGISWQLVHVDFEKIMSQGDPVKQERVMKALMQMTKPDINQIRQAFEG